MGPIRPKPSILNHNRNQAGRSVKAFAGPSSESPSGSNMKQISPIKEKKIKRTSGWDTPRIGKKTSVVWNFFKSMPNDNGCSRAVCSLCKVVFKYPGGSTTGMRGHLKRKHPGAIEIFTIRSRKSLMAAKRKVNKVVTEARAPVTPPPPPPPPPLVENGSGGEGEVDETQIFEDSESMVGLETEYSNQSTSAQGSSNGGLYHFSTPTPDAYTMNDAVKTAKNIVLYLVSNMKPLQSVDDPFFKKMIQDLIGLFLLGVTGGNQNNESLLPQVATTLDNMYHEVKEEIRREIQDNYISIALEIWVKSHYEIYMMATANFITQDWRFQSRLLGMRLLPNAHSKMGPSAFEENITAALTSVLNEYEVSRNRILNVFINCSPLQPPPKVLSLPTFPCFLDVVRKTYSALDELIKPFIKYSITTECDILAKELQLRILQDAKFHPGKIVEAVKNLIEHPSEEYTLPQTRLELEDITSFVKLQRPINEVVECLLEEPFFTTSTIIPIVCAVRDLFEVDIECNPNFPAEKKTIATEVNRFMQKMFSIDLSSNTIGDTTLAICTFFDPRYKKLKFFTEDQRQTIYDAVMELLNENERKTSENSGTGTIVSVRSENPNYSNMNGNGSFSSDQLNTSFSSISSSQLYPPKAGSSKLASLLTKVIQRKHVPAPSSDSQEEFRKYLREPVPIMEMDPCKWWNGNHDKYPNLSAIARRYLCMKAFTLPASLAFTNARDTFYNALGNLEPEYVEKMLCIRRHHISTTPVDSLLESRGSRQTTVIQHSLVEVKTEAIDIELMDEDMSTK